METDGQERAYFGSLSSEEVDEFIKDFAISSDRSTAVAGLAMLESAVTTAIRFVFCREDKHSRKLIGDDESGGELGFTDQCRLAYCLGLIGENTLSDLMSMARVRNRIGHSLKAITFENQDIINACNSLWVPDALDGVLRSHNGLKQLLSQWKAKGRYMYSVYAVTDVLGMELRCRPDMLSKPFPRWLK